MGAERKETLLAQAERISSAPSHAEDLYWWTSDTEVLMLRPCSKPKFFQLSSLDTRTGKEAPLDAFNQAFSKKVVGQMMIVTVEGEPGSETVYNPPTCDVSPDGKWFLWLHAQRTWIAASLDGTKKFKWKKSRGDSDHGFWLPDSMRWVELVSRYRGHRYTVTKAVVHSFDDDLVRELEELHLGDGIVAGVSRSGEFLLWYLVFDDIDAKDDDIDARDSVTLVNLESEPPSARNSSIQLSLHWRISEAQLSPVTNRVAWMLEAGDYFPWEYSLCVSDIEGKGMREIGYMLGKSESSAANDRGRVYFYPESIRWLPDGQRISFVFKGELYVLDAS